MKPTADTTLREARAWLQPRLRKGEECPCCRRWAKVNVYSISATAARALILLVRIYERRRTWVHSKEIAAAHSGVDARKMLACTHVPESSLKSSAIRPEYSRPSIGRCGSTQRTASPVLK